MNTKALKEELNRFCCGEPIKDSFINISENCNLNDNYVLPLLHYKVAELVAPTEIEGFMKRNFTWHFRVEHRDKKIYPVIFLGRQSAIPAAGWEIVRKEQLDQLLNVVENNGKYDITLA